MNPEQWIPITDNRFFDADPKWAHDGKLLYFESNRDGSTCLWGVRINASTHRPEGEPFPVWHFHGNPRHYSWYPDFSVGSGLIVISIERVESDLWRMQLPSRP